MNTRKQSISSKFKNKHKEQNKQKENIKSIGREPYWFLPHQIIGLRNQNKTHAKIIKARIITKLYSKIIIRLHGQNHKKAKQLGNRAYFT